MFSYISNMYLSVAIIREIMQAIITVFYMQKTVLGTKSFQLKSAIRF